MRVGRSIWSREDFNQNNPTSSLIFSRTSKSAIKFHSDTELNHTFDVNTDQSDPQEIPLPHGNLINSSKKIFSNRNFRSRIYKQHQFILKDGTIKTIYYFRSTEIPVDHNGPFWPLAFPLKHPTLSFLFLTRNENKYPRKEYYDLHNHHFLGTKNQQTFDNQSAVNKYTDVFKHSVIIYDMDKSPRQQESKPLESEQTCPSLIFESRFEGGNLKQVKRV
jgi:hypothetical protein